MDTQSKVTVKALSTIKHGAEGSEATTYNAGDIFEVTAKDAADLLSYRVVEVSDQVAQEVAQVTATSEAATVIETPAETVQVSNPEITNVSVANPTAEDIAATLALTETEPAITTIPLQ